MPDTSDWKQKYRDSLQEMEIEEKRWRHVEGVLRRLIGRLCAAGMGVHGQLDDELVALAAANRRNADADELARMASSLTVAVAAVDAIAPVLVASPVRPIAAAPPPMPAPVCVPLPPTPVRWTATCEAVAAVLTHLRADESESPVSDALLAEVALANDDAELAAILLQVADLVYGRGELLARERLQAAGVLAAVTERLDDMGRFLDAATDAGKSRFADTESLNDCVMTQVRELSAEVHGATDFSFLQAMVSSRLDMIAQQVVDFRAREHTRMLEQAGSAEHLRARIATLEQEATDLTAKLDREKHGARLDPLTRVANRKSFDERFALEIVRRSQNEIPVALLLWDLDNFKVINDTYGHRAGDRVLQSVATYFMSAVRTRDFVARIGGEEFVVLLSGLTADAAVRIANELRQGVEALRFHFRGTQVRVTVSCGVTALRQHDAADTAFDRADAALYKAKHEGRNLCIAA